MTQSEKWINENTLLNPTHRTDMWKSPLHPVEGWPSAGPAPGTACSRAPPRIFWHLCINTRSCGARHGL